MIDDYLLLNVLCIHLGVSSPKLQGKNMLMVVVPFPTAVCGATQCSITPFKRQLPIAQCFDHKFKRNRGYHADIQALVDDFRLPNSGPCLMMAE
jgi:hypothetical protein